MILPKFELFRPRSLSEALDWLDANRSRRVKVLAGGTDLLVDVRREVIPAGHRPPLSRPSEGVWQAIYRPVERPEALCALWNIPELGGIRQEGRSIHIGVMTTLATLERSPIVREKLGALFDGAYQLGSALVRNRGTYGGNLCNARPAADTAIPTLALGGKLVLISPRGERIVDHAAFTTGPGKTVLAPDEILKEVIFDLNSLSSIGSIGSSYIKLAQRKSLEISVVGCAASVGFDARKNVETIRIAMGAVAPTPVLVPVTLNSMIGKPLDETAILSLAKTASEYAKPISDHRGGKDYRKRMVDVLVRRALTACLGRAFASGREAAR